jgi:hypothetical protein
MVDFGDDDDEWDMDEERIDTQLSGCWVVS